MYSASNVNVDRCRQYECNRMDLFPVEFGIAALFIEERQVLIEKIVGANDSGRNYQTKATESCNVCHKYLTPAESKE